MSKNNVFGKILSRLMMATAILTSCNDNDLNADGGDKSPLQIKVRTDVPSTRALNTDRYLPDGESIGIALFDSQGGDYDRQGYTNVQYKASGTGEAQTWVPQGETPSISSNVATLVAYWPYNGGADDLTAVPVETDSQTDYMYSDNIGGISNVQPSATITLHHALTAVKVKLVLGNYTGPLNVTGISVESTALGAAAKLNVKNGMGTLTDITGLGDAKVRNVDFDLTAEGTETDFLFVPDGHITSGTTKITANIGGKVYASQITFGKAYLQGYVYTYILTLNNEGFKVTKVLIDPWKNGESESGSLSREDDNVYSVKIKASYVEQVGPASLIEDGEVAYSNNISTVQSRSGETFVFKHNIVGFVGTIDWGDGITTTYDVATDNPSHEYPNDGAEYTITAKGTIHSLYSGGDVFQQCLKEIINIGKDCGITSMVRAFVGTGITAFPEGLFDNCTEVTTFSETFAGCTSLQNIPEGLFDKCTKVTDFYMTFQGCSSLTRIPEGLFDNCTEVENFNSTFAECRSLETIPEGIFDNCPEVTSFVGTFRWCPGLQEIPEGLFDYNTEVTSFAYTFHGCESLTEIPAGLFDNCTKVTDFYYCFSGTGITSIPEGLFDYNTKVTSFRLTFGSCYNLQTIPERLFDYNTEVTNFEGTFYWCTSLTGESPYTVIQVDGVDTKVHLYERKNYPDVFTAPTSYTDCFYKCTGLTDYTNIPAEWK